MQHYYENSYIICAILAKKTVNLCMLDIKQCKKALIVT